MSARTAVKMRLLHNAKRASAPPPPVSIAIDSIADASLKARQEAEATPLACDHCGDVIEGEPAGRGLYLWTRGEETRIEEPALCERCSIAIGVTALASFGIEEEEG